MTKAADFQALLNRYRDGVIETRAALMGDHYTYGNLLKIECGIAQELQDMFEAEVKGEKA